MNTKIAANCQLVGYVLVASAQDFDVYMDVCHDLAQQRKGKRKKEKKKIKNRVWVMV